jgi:hypothetical protein
LLPKLREHKPLTPEDWKALEPLIVGDSESFVKYGADVATRRKNQSAATLPLLRLDKLDSCAVVNRHG